MKRRTALQAFAGMLGAATGVTVAKGHSDQSSGYRPLGTVSVSESAEAVVGDDGKTAFVATQDGFATVDISDPANPQEITEVTDILSDHDAGPLINVQDVKIDGDQLLVVGPANRQRNETLRGAALYDVADPANPTRVGFHETSYPIHNAIIRDGIAYLTGQGQTGGGDIHMIDVTGENMEELASWAGPSLSEDWKDVTLGFLGSPHDLWVQNGVAYVARWDTGTWIVDVSDPANPTLLSHIEGLSVDTYTSIGSQSELREQFLEPPGNHHYARTSPDGSLLGIGIESSNVEEEEPEENDTGGAGGVMLYDISDKTNPQRVATIQAPESYLESFEGLWTTAHNFDIRNGRLYTSWYQGGVQVHDISNPAQPERLAWWRQPDTAAFWTAQYATEEFFIASLYDTDRLSSTGSGLYTFPNEPGKQANPPSLTATPTPAPTPTPTETPSPTPTPTPSPTPTRTETPTAEPNDTETTAVSTPGFGVLSAAVAGGAAVLHRLLNTSDESDDDTS